MAEIPETAEAAYLAFILVEELIDLLLGSGRIERSEATELFSTALVRVRNDTRAVAKLSAEILHKIMSEKYLSEVHHHHADDMHKP